MSEPFLAEVRMIGFNFPPRGWSFCDGQILPINQNQSLYSLLGTTYGGDGRTSFALPELRGRAPIHEGQGNGLSQRSLGQGGGAEGVALTESQIPEHTHSAHGTTGAAATTSPAGARLGAATGTGRTGTPIIYSEPVTPSTTPLAAGTVASSGSGAHENMQPSLALNFVIALQGLFPSRN